jgi:hypothetical protein
LRHFATFKCHAQPQAWGLSIAGQAFTTVETHWRIQKNIRPIVEVASSNKAQLASAAYKVDFFIHV